MRLPRPVNVHAVTKVTDLGSPRSHTGTWSKHLLSCAVSLPAWRACCSSRWCFVIRPTRTLRSLPVLWLWSLPITKMSLFSSSPAVSSLKQKSRVWAPAPPRQGEVHPGPAATILPSPSDRRNPHSWDQSYLGGFPQLQACSQHQEPPLPIWVGRWGQIPNSGNQQGRDIQGAATEDARQEEERQAWETQGAGKEETANSICLAKLWHGWEWARRGPPVWRLRDVAGAQFTVTGFHGNSFWALSAAEAPLPWLGEP